MLASVRQPATTAPEALPLVIAASPPSPPPTGRPVDPKLLPQGNVDVTDILNAVGTDKGVGRRLLGQRTLL